LGENGTIHDTGRRSLYPSGKVLLKISLC
jgi:hypothetical protein